MSHNELMSEIRHRALVLLRQNYLHNMEYGLLIPDDYMVIDGYAMMALDNTD